MKYPDRFIVVDPSSLPWTQAKSPSGPKGIRYRTIVQGNGKGDGLPQVHLNQYQPGWTEPRHRHVEDEVLILTSGSLEIEGVEYTAPATLFVGRHTLYGPLTAGARGAEFYRVAFSEKLMALDKASVPVSGGKRERAL